MSENLKKYGKQPQFKTWAMISDKRGFRFQEWDELDESNKLVWIKKYIYEIIDPYDCRSPEERDTRNATFKKDPRQLKLSRWKKTFMAGSLRELNQVEYFYECERMKFLLSDNQKNHIQKNAELMCLRKTNAYLKADNKKYQTMDEENDKLQWEIIDLKNNIQELENRLEVKGYQLDNLS